MLRKNELIKSDGMILRVLKARENEAFVIDCVKRTMPVWMVLKEAEPCTENDIDFLSPDVDEEITDQDMKTAHERLTMIIPVLACVEERNARNRAIAQAAEEYQVSKQTVRSYLCRYLIYQNITALAPRPQREGLGDLSEDEKNMRWALNKFFYTRNKNSLTDAFVFMIKSRYCDAEGNVMEKHPSIHQFRYFYRKTRKLQTYYISRDGIKNYERNNRPLLGDGIQEFTPSVGTAMVDATVCDLYLINEAGSLVGRPILTAAIDGFSSVCVGYSLQWEGGIYSVRNLMKNILADKVQWCKDRGVAIKSQEWNCSKLPSVFVTDAGSEYRSETFEQLADLGALVINLPSYRPELKGNVEKFFDLVQDTYKTHLKGKGVIEPDFMERGSHDYRKDACLTMDEFERIVLQCIVYYNSQRILENYPYTEEMLKEKVKPHANAVYEWGTKQLSCHLLDVDEKKVMLTLLPRTTGKFDRQGLHVNGMRYKADGFTESYLGGGEAVVAYNPDDVSRVWLIQNRTEYVPFELIGARYQGKSLSEIESMQIWKGKLIKEAQEANLQGKVDLANSIQVILETRGQAKVSNTKDIRKTRSRERTRQHIDFLKGDTKDENE